MKVVFSEEADSDLLQILTYIAARNRVAAVALANLFNTKIDYILCYVNRPKEPGTTDFQV